MILIITAMIAAAVVIKLLFSGRKDRLHIYRRLLKKAVEEGGYLKSSGLRSCGDVKTVKEILNTMSKDGVLTIHVADKNNIEYVFPGVPRSYKPVKIRHLDEFNSSLSLMGLGSEDGHVFLSEIIFAFDMEYCDITEALEIYCENRWVTKNISNSGNLYLMFDKELMEQT